MKGTEPCSATIRPAAAVPMDAGQVGPARLWGQDRWVRPFFSAGHPTVNRRGPTGEGRVHWIRPFFSREERSSDPEEPHAGGAHTLVDPLAGKTGTTNGYTTPGSSASRPSTPSASGPATTTPPSPSAAEISGGCWSRPLPDACVAVYRGSGDVIVSWTAVRCR
jgi:hypothetical protein